MQTRLQLVFTCLLVALVAFGCQNTMTPPVTSPTIDTSDPRAKLVLGSTQLLGKIAMGETLFRQLGQLSQAQVLVQNLTDQRYTLEHKVDWKTNEGFNAGGATSWHRFTLAPRETKTITSTGKEPEARTIVFTVRLPDDVFIDNSNRLESAK